MRAKPILRKVVSAISFMVLGFFTAHVINILVTTIIIGDPEAYATSNIKTGPVFNLFYEISSNTGYHPEPSEFNSIFVTLIGLTLGGIFAYKSIKRADIKPGTNI